MNFTQKFLTKKMLVLAFLATASVSFPKLSNDVVSNCYETQREGQWKYLEYLFVVQPNNSLQASAKKLQAVSLTSAAALFLTKNQIYQLVTGSKETETTAKATGPDGKEEKAKGLAFDGPTAIASGVLCIAAYYAYFCKIERAVKKETIINFLKNWSHHRKYVPQELVPAFDELAAGFALSKTKNFTESQVNEIFEIVQHLLEHCFDKRYSKDKKDGDMISTLKTITEIGKNLSPSSK